MASNPHDSQNWIQKKLEKIEIKPFLFHLIMLKKKHLGDNLNFEGAPLKLQTPIK
jgi:hypothetical protein